MEKTQKNYSFKGFSKGAVFFDLETTGLDVSKERIVQLAVVKINIDGSKEEMRFPAESWKLNYEQVTKMIVTEKQIASVILDSKYETADVDMFNNFFPRRILESRFDLIKQGARNRRDMMHENLEEPKSLEEYIEEQQDKDAENERDAARNFDALVKEYQ